MNELDRKNLITVITEVVKTLSKKHNVTIESVVNALVNKEQAVLEQFGVLFVEGCKIANIDTSKITEADISFT